MEDRSKPSHSKKDTLLKKEATLAEQQQAKLAASNQTPIPNITEVEDIQKIAVVEEQLQVTKKMVKTGTVTVTKETTEKEVTVDTSYTTHEVEVKRVAVGRKLEEGAALPTTRTEGDLTIIPVIKEVEEVIIRKRHILVEEIHLQRKTIEHPQEKTVVLKQQQARIERQSEENSLPTDTKHTT
jgi:uncharacterized protein (TIGR02271 family)